MNYPAKIPKPLSTRHRHYRVLLTNGAQLVVEVHKDAFGPSIAKPFDDGGEIVCLPGSVVAVAVGRGHRIRRSTLNDLSQAFSCPIVVEGE
jgi:hypothetical protein